jgi:hypothetical protein
MPSLTCGCALTVMLETMPKEWPAPRRAGVGQLGFAWEDGEEGGGPGVNREEHERAEGHTPPEISVLSRRDSDSFAARRNQADAYDIVDGHAVVALETA